MVFIGYAALTVPAVLALVALFRKNDDGEWVGPALRWSLAGFVLLGVGIILGGFWAYKVLGWGGYWGWDPVENASLIPWIAVVALLHGLLVQKATGSLKRTNYVLALSTYLLVLYSTFLTRSGVLANFSVHSFPESTIFRELVAIMAIVGGVSVLGLLLHRGEPAGPSIPLRLGWPLVLTGAVLLLVMSGILVLVATSWPIISSVAGNPATIATSFYNQANLPLYLVLFALLIIAPFLAWGGARQGWWNKLLLPAVAAVILSVVAVGWGAKVDVFLLFFFLAAFALGTATVRFVQRARLRMLSTGAPVAHAGFALMFMGIVANSVWGAEQAVSLPLNQPVEALGVDMRYLGHVEGSEPEHQWLLSVQKPGGAEKRRTVTMYRMANGGDEQSLMRKPAIFRELFRDVYVVPTAIQEAQGNVHQLDLIKGQPITMHGATITFQRFEVSQTDEGHGMLVQCIVEVTLGESSEVLSLPFSATGGRMEGMPIALTVLPNTSFRVAAISVEQKLIRVIAEESAAGAVQPPTMVVQASSKPLMSVMWLGTMFLCLGCVVAVARRVVDLRLAAGQDGALHLVKKGKAAA
jgi:cytochrome c-type biogenesis protein CcmF